MILNKASFFIELMKGSMWGVRFGALAL